MTSPQLDARTHALARSMEDFEATESVANTGTGSRREGEGFERLVGDFWEAVREAAVTAGASCTFVAGVGNHRWAKLTREGRALYLPNNPHRPVSDPNAQPTRWLEVAFNVSELIASFPGEAEAIRRYAPDIGQYAGSDYPAMYSGLSTKFDDTVVLEEGNALKEKILLEYKTAKSSKHRQLDGNAHERLSFQIMQYLEVATRYSRCTLMVMANGAFAKYRNKYHPNFHVQADRLRTFAWFTMDHICTMRDYSDFVAGLLGWLHAGTDRRIGRLAQ